MGVEEFKDLLLCCGNIYLWKLDSGGNLLQSNCPDEAVWAQRLNCSAVNSAS